MAMANYFKVDYYMEASSSIEAVQKMARQLQLNVFQCQYLSSKLADTRKFLKDRSCDLMAIHDNADIRRKALLKLHFVVKRCEKLVQNCCCFKESWLESAVTLVNIKEEIVDILLDMRWWTSMVHIAIASVIGRSSGERIELELLKSAEEDFDILMNQLHSSPNDLDEAAAKDIEQLLKRLRELQASYAGGTRDPEQKHEYLLAAHLRSRLENSELETTADLELNGYQDLRLIGHGASGAVLNVRWLRRKCALKILNCKCSTEAASRLSAFQHPHIVQFFRYWEAPLNARNCDSLNGAPRSDTSMAAQASKALKSHILMELLPTDLADHIEGLIDANDIKGTPKYSMPVDVAIDVMLQVAKAMWHLSNKDATHWGLKPKNVLVRPVPRDEVPELSAQGYLRVKLADFGLAKTEAMSASISKLTCNVGTRVYGAPEVFGTESFPEKMFPRKADVWSFGIMFSQVLTGNPPWEVTGVDGTRFLHDKIRYEGLRPQLPENCPDYLKFCVTSCWEFLPEDRPNFKDIWRMVRLAQVRSLGLIRANHDLFTYKTREGVKRLDHINDMAMADYFEVDYLIQASSSIAVVQKMASRLQLNVFQCQYLAAKLAETGKFLTDSSGYLMAIHDNADIRRKALLKLHFVVKRCEKLVRNCCCFEESWLESAVTMVKIKEDIVDILLDLRWWTSMVHIAIASFTWLSSGERIELELLKSAEEDFDILMNQLHSSPNDLDEAAAKDIEQLLKRLRELQASYAGGTRDPEQKHEYLLAAHLRSRLENSELETTADLELNGYQDLRLIGHGASGAVLNVRWLRRKCALKILNCKCSTEAASRLSAFQHPHIVQFFRYWEAPLNARNCDSLNGAPRSDTSMAAQASKALKSHILMELLPTDLADHIEGLIDANDIKGTPKYSMPVDVAIDVMLQVAKAMWHLSNKDATHWGLKPKNVLVRPVPRDEVPELSAQGYLRVKLANFGMMATKAKSHEAVSTLKGARVYVTPEVFRPESFSSKLIPWNADVWNFGVVFSEVLTGNPPWEAAGQNFRHGKIRQVIKQGLRQVIKQGLRPVIKQGLRPELPENCPDYLKFCIRSCWESRPEHRPNFKDIWRMVRLAQVRSLGLIRANHDLFTYKTRDEEKMMTQSKKTPASEQGKQPSLKSNSLWSLLRQFTHLLFRSLPAFRSEDKPLGCLVNQVWPVSASDSELDVIFFEGNVGSRIYLSCKDTWVQRGEPDVCWPRDWLPNDVKSDIRVLLLEYSISEAGIEGVGDELQRLLVFRDRWNRGHTWQRPIVLVGHSLGCVVIEQLVVALDKKARSIDSLKDEIEIGRAKVSKAFLESLAGCFFYAPPHRGLEPTENLLEHVFGGLTYTKYLFKDLCFNSSKLKDLSEAFMVARSKQVKLMALTEGYQTLERMVVPRASMLEFEGPVEELEDSNHRDTCKPANKDHRAYQKLLEFIGDILNNQKIILDQSGSDKRPVDMFKE